MPSQFSDLLHDECFLPPPRGPYTTNLTWARLILFIEKKMTIMTGADHTTQRERGLRGERKICTAAASRKVEAPLREQRLRKLLHTKIAAATTNNGRDFFVDNMMETRPRCYFIASLKRRGAAGGEAREMNHLTYDLFASG